MACAHSLTGRPPAPALAREAPAGVAGRVSPPRPDDTHAASAAWATHEQQGARIASRPASAAATATPPPMPADVAALTGTADAVASPAGSDLTVLLPAPPPTTFDDRAIVLPAGVAPPAAAPAEFNGQTVVLPAGTTPGEAPGGIEGETVMLAPDAVSPRAMPVGAEDHTVMLPPGGEDDSTVMLPHGPTPPVGAEDHTVMLPAGASRVTPSRITPSRITPASGTPFRSSSRGASPLASRMSVLSSLADVDSTTLLTEGLEIAGRYRVKSLIGKGGMGVVYLVDDLELEREIALKVIRSDIASSPQSLERFKREIQLSSKVTHRNVLRVYDLGESEGVKFLTMEYVQGQDLSDIVKRDGKLPFDRVMNYFQQICAGLGVAHEQGVIHRDLKPQNVMIDPTDRVLLTDFGLATVAEASSAAKSGAIMGTPYYMSPEQVRGEELDQRSDIYALGIMLYEQLTGAIPFAGGSVMDVMKRRLTDKPRPIGELNPDLPQYIRKVIDKCLATDREERYASCEEIVKDIYEATEGKRRRRQAAAIMSLAAFLVIGAVGASSWYVYQQKRAAALKEHEPVSVLISDFSNGTGDPAFERTLEPLVKMGLEGAGFISAYDRSAIARTFDVRPPEKLDERAALELAVKQGLNVVLSGSVERDGNRYPVSVKATQSVSGNVIRSETRTASSKDQIVPVATKLVASVRKALGDTTSASAQQFAMETLSARSLEAVREYANGMDALAGGKSEEALLSFSKSVKLDPGFGTAYGAMAAVSKNLDRQQDAVSYAKQAVSHLDGMTERERYRARGYYYFLINDYNACVKEYGDLIARYSADAMARNNRALCLSNLRELPKAVDEMRQAVKVLPNKLLFRQNLAFYAAYSSDFKTAAEQVTAMGEPDLFGLLARAFAEIGTGAVADATETYEAMATVDEQGASYTSSGLADLAVYEGRYSDAARILTQGAAADVASKDPDRAANKFAALANVQLLRGQKAAAISAAEKALANSSAVKIRFLAARVFVEAGATARAGTISAALGSELQSEPQAYASIIDGLIAMKNGNVRQAIKAFTDANALLDTWIGHYDLGRAYLAAGAYLQADSEFDRCVKRRGEALALFLDEEPTYGFFPPVYYYQGLVRDGLKSEKAGESYNAYLAIRGNSTEDPLLPVVRNRAAAAAVAVPTGTNK